MKIIDYAKFIMKELKINLKIKFDLSKPDGTPQKIIDCTVAKKYGWKPRICFKKGFELTYKNYLETID